MPKRTNEFQELVTLVQRALAPIGAKITPSAMFDVPGQVSQREIDILIESAVGPYKIKVAVEAKDEGRKMDQPRFEQLLAKYYSEGSIKVNKLVVVTHHGFYEPVIERAKLYGDQIELLTYRQAKSADWVTMPPSVIQLAISPHLCGFKFSPQVDGVDTGRLQAQARIVCSHGKDYGTPESYAARVLQSKLLVDRPTLIQELAQRALSEPSGQAFAHIEFGLDHHFLVVDGKQFSLKKMGFSVHVVNAKSSVEYDVCEITTAGGETHAIPMAKAIVGGKRIQFVLPGGLQSERIVVKIENSDSSSAGVSTSGNQIGPG